MQDCRSGILSRLLSTLFVPEPLPKISSTKSLDFLLSHFHNVSSVNVVAGSLYVKYTASNDMQQGTISQMQDTIAQTESETGFVNIVNEDQLKTNFPCTTCGKTYTRADHLLRHQRTRKCH